MEEPIVDRRHQGINVLSAKELNPQLRLLEKNPVKESYYNALGRSNLATNNKKAFCQLPIANSQTGSLDKSFLASLFTRDRCFTESDGGAGLKDCDRISDEISSFIENGDVEQKKEMDVALANVKSIEVESNRHDMSVVKKNDLIEKEPTKSLQADENPESAYETVRVENAKERDYPNSKTLGNKDLAFQQEMPTQRANGYRDSKSCDEEGNRVKEDEGNGSARLNIRISSDPNDIDASRNAADAIPEKRHKLALQAPEHEDKTTGRISSSEDKFPVTILTISLIISLAKLEVQKKMHRNESEMVSRSPRGFGDNADDESRKPLFLIRECANDSGLRNKKERVDPRQQAGFDVETYGLGSTLENLSEIHRIMEINWILSRNATRNDRKLARVTNSVNPHGAESSRDLRKIFLKVLLGSSDSSPRFAGGACIYEVLQWKEVFLVQRNCPNDENLLKDIYAKDLFRKTTKLVQSQEMMGKYGAILLGTQIRSRPIPYRAIGEFGRDEVGCSVTTRSVRLDDVKFSCKSLRLHFISTLFPLPTTSWRGLVEENFEPKAEKMAYYLQRTAKPESEIWKPARKPLKTKRGSGDRPKNTENDLKTRSDSQSFRIVQLHEYKSVIWTICEISRDGNKRKCNLENSKIALSQGTLQGYLGFKPRSNLRQRYNEKSAEKTDLSNLKHNGRRVRVYTYSDDVNSRNHYQCSLVHEGIISEMPQFVEVMQPPGVISDIASDPPGQQSVYIPPGPKTMMDHCSVFRDFSDRS